MSGPSYQFFETLDQFLARSYQAITRKMELCEIELKSGLTKIPLLVRNGANVAQYFLQLSTLGSGINCLDFIFYNNYDYISVVDNGGANLFKVTRNSANDFLDIKGNVNIGINDDTKYATVPSIRIRSLQKLWPIRDISATGITIARRAFLVNGPTPMYDVKITPATYFASTATSNMIFSHTNTLVTTGDGLKIYINCNSATPTFLRSRGLLTGTVCGALSVYGRFKWTPGAGGTESFRFGLLNYATGYGCIIMTDPADQTKLRFSCINVAGTTNEDGITLTGGLGIEHNYSIIYWVNTSDVITASLYVDGVLKKTITTNLPAITDAMNFYIETTGTAGPTASDIVADELGVLTGVRYNE